MSDNAPRGLGDFLFALFGPFWPLAQIVALLVTIKLLMWACAP